MKKSNPMRRCVGCMQSYPREQLIRLTMIDNNIEIDYTIRADGRGMYICRKEECVNKSFKRKSWNRLCKSNLNVNMLERLNAELLREVKNVKES